MLPCRVLFTLTATHPSATLCEIAYRCLIQRGGGTGPLKPRQPGSNRHPHPAVSRRLVLDQVQVRQESCGGHLRDERRARR